MARVPIPMGHRHYANGERARETGNTRERINGGERLTQFYVLVIGEDEDDVGPDVAEVAVLLQPRLLPIARQVAGAVGRGEKDSRRDEKEEEKREPCHRASRQSPPRSFVSHAGVCGTLTQPGRRDTEGD